MDLFLHLKGMVLEKMGQQCITCTFIGCEIRWDKNLYEFIITFTGYGVRTDGTTIYINASSCTQSYEPSNPAIVFDMPIPPGCTEVCMNNLYVFMSI